MTHLPRFMIWCPGVVVAVGLALVFGAPLCFAAATGGDSLPDAPVPNLVTQGASATTETTGDAAESGSRGAFDTGALGWEGAGEAGGAIKAPTPKEVVKEQLDSDCASGRVRGKPCRVHWLPVLWQSFEFTAYQNVGNIALDEETRHDLVTLPYWSTYVYCVQHFRYDQWRDDDSFMVDYVAHGLQGGIAADTFIQNDPKGRGLVYVNNGNYWRSRLKAMAWGAVYEVQWKIGPASEASIGASGRNTYVSPKVHGRTTNETGFQDFVDTPVIGLGWNIGEDAMDRFVMPKIWSRTHNRLALSALSILTPSKAAANLLRYKPLYYRDFAITALR